MEYLLLIHDDETLFTKLNEAERNSLYQEYGAYTESLKSSGVYRDGRQLQPTSTATTVTVRDGEQVVTDGPFAETKEQLGGFYLIEVDSLDEAIEWAAKIPSARGGKIEVRPLVPLGVPAQ
jgi:hypothetical protein